MSRPRGSSTELERRSLLGFTNALASAFLEWLLMFLIFVDAIFAYLVARLARCCDLRTPCLLCSRLDHILGNEKLGFYWELICSSHKLEISSLVFCHAHDKLVDVHAMCEGCLFSFATVNKSNAETYRLLVGKMGTEPHNYVSPSRGGCSCCNEPCTSKPYNQEWLPTKSDGCEAAAFDLPLLSSIARSVSDKWKDISSPPASTFRLDSPRLDPLSRMGYAKLKVTSDTESEALLSENDDENSLASETGDAREDFLTRCVNSESSAIASTNDFTPINLVDPQHFEHKLSLLDLEVPAVLIEHNGGTSVAPMMANDHGLLELSWKRAEPKTDLPFETELISSAPPLSSVPATTTEVLIENSPADCIEANDGTSVEPMMAHYHGVEELSWEQTKPKTDPTLKAELIFSAAPLSTLPETTTEVLIENKVLIEDNDGTSVASTIAKDHVLEVLSWQQTEPKSNLRLETNLVSPAPPLSNLPETTTEVFLENIAPSTTDVHGNDVIGHTCLTETGKISMSGSEPMVGRELAIGTGAQMSGSLDLVDAYKLAVSNKGRQLLSRQWSQKDSSRVNDDRSFLLSQNSPRNAGENRSSDLGSAGSQIFQKRISLERNVSNLSMDGSTVSEIEGESLVDRLKRQVDHDRKLLGALYKELEEERNASAIATSQSMAMITRLQEEKAALHMEALQYLRMMEEQSEYDMEALEKTNDLLADKEKEMQDLEYELLFYREKFPSEYVIENMVDSVHDVRVEGVEERNTNCPCKTEESKIAVGVADKNNVKNPLSEFEDERLYISQCLKKLQEKLTVVSNGGVCMELRSGEYSGNEGNEASTSKKLNHKKDFEENVAEEENNGSHPNAQDQVDLSSQNTDNKNGDHCLESGLVALEIEVSDLNDRLEALEVDRKFLEKTINSLRNGDEGLQFLQEIVHHLRELRKSDTRSCSPMVA